MPIRTPLYESHVKLGGHMVEFSGWLLPVNYEGILREHEAVRHDAGLFDTCHMTRIRVTGGDAEVSLDSILTVPVLEMETGQCKYGFMLNHEGGVIDDLIVYRFDTEWWVVMNAGRRADKLEWIKTHVSDGTFVEDVTDDMAKIDLQGPNSKNVLRKSTGLDVGEIPFFRCGRFRSNKGDLTISRTGYTGEHGYEIYLESSLAPRLWTALIQAGAEPAGLGARDTLRLEAGLPLYGHELNDELTPVHAGLGRFAQKKADYIGRGAVEQTRNEGATPILIGFQLSGRRAARANQEIYRADRKIGRVTSGSMLPTVGYAGGMAFVEAGDAEPGLKLEIDTGRCRLTGEVKQLPLYKSPRKARK